MDSISKDGMTNRQRTMAILNGEPYDRLPIVHFGFWGETLAKWAEEGHLTDMEARKWADGNRYDVSISRKLGFDFNWYSVFTPNASLRPPFQRRVICTLEDGSEHVRERSGVTILLKKGVEGIPPEVGHTLIDRDSWSKNYLKRLQWTPERVEHAWVCLEGKRKRFDRGGRELLQAGQWDIPFGLHCGSLYGQIRDWMGLERSCTILMEDPELYREMIDTVGELSYQTAKYVLESGARFDFAHFWEDIACKNGPLVIPSIFAELVGPHYRRITSLVAEHGIKIVSLDCDGCIDALVPIWFENGVNTMFPIEVGTWDACIAPWRRQYGPSLRGVGGMNKTVFARDRAAIDVEIERLRPMIALGGYIPCPDHRIAPDAKWDLVRYYCERMRESF